MRVRAGPAEAVFEDGRLFSLQLDGQEMLLPTLDAIVGGSYVMAPFAGRVRNGRLHWEGRT